MPQGVFFSFSCFALYSPFIHHHVISDFSVPLLNQSAVMNDIKDERQPSIAELNTMLADISSELGLPAPFEEDFLKMKIETIKIETPLSKLEGMKAQLPEVEVNPNGM